MNVKRRPNQKRGHHPPEKTFGPPPMPEIRKPLTPPERRFDQLFDHESQSVTERLSQGFDVPLHLRNQGRE